MVPEIKICGITNEEDARYAASSGASILGVILSNRSPRKGTVELVRELSVSGYSIAGVYTDFESVRKESSLEDFIQLHFVHGIDEIKFVRNELGKKVISVIFPEKDTDFMEDADEKLKNGADLVLLEYGREINSSDIEGLPDLTGKKIGLAGKISETNLSTVMRANPFFIDLSSKLEEYPGKKDHGKIKSFMEVFRLEITPF